MVGVVGEVEGKSFEADDFPVDRSALARESPRVGRSTRCVELYEEPDVAGDSSRARDSVGTGDAL